jgi:hypothetical protein
MTLVFRNSARKLWLALNVRDRHTPFLSLFIIHEVRVHGFHPFSPVAPTDGAWKDWIVAGSVFDSDTISFKRERPRRSRSNISSQQLPEFQMNVDVISKSGRKYTEARLQFWRR